MMGEAMHVQRKKVFGNTVFSSQSCCESETALKKTKYIFKKLFNKKAKFLNSCPRIVIRISSVSAPSILLYVIG